jgi:dephospho-CoA kinase
MLKVGVTGGMACGKSVVATALGGFGCHVIEADAIGHRVMEPSGEAYAPVVAAFGDAILDARGHIVRSRLGERVFGDPAQLERLNAIVHPAVRARALREFADLAARDPHGIVVYVAAILIESGAYLEVDKIIVVSCTRGQQIERALQRPDVSETTVLARLERQLPLEKKKEFGDYIVDASGSLEETLRQTEVVYRDLRRLAS